MNEIQPVRPKDQFTFSCRQCGECCRNIEGCVMVESLGAYRLARYLRTKGEPIEGIEDFLFRYWIFCIRTFIFSDTFYCGKSDGGSDDGGRTKLFHMAFYLASSIPLYYPSVSYYSPCTFDLL